MGSFALQASSARAGSSAAAANSPIDRAYLARFTMGNEELEQEVLELFAAQAPLYLDRLRSAETTADWKEAAHTIKGSAAAVGARQVAHFAELAEKIAPGEKVRRDKALRWLAEATNEACGHIERMFGK